MFGHAHHEHTAEAIATRLSEGPKALYLREWIYGGIDGVVTTFAIVAAVIGAGLSPVIVIIMGLANLIGDGFSMAASSYSGAKAEADKYESLRLIEKRHVRQFPEGEREETRQILAAKGFSPEDIEPMIDIMTKDEDSWIEFMLQEEYGVSRSFSNPLKVAMHTFLSFVVCGCMPLLPYVLDIPYAGYAAFFMAALTFFTIGSFRSLWSIDPWWKDGLETLAIGCAASGMAFLIGYLLKGFIPA